MHINQCFTNSNSPANSSLRWEIPHHSTPRDRIHPVWSEENKAFVDWTPYLGVMVEWLTSWKAIGMLSQDRILPISGYVNYIVSHNRRQLLKKYSYDLLSDKKEGKIKENIDLKYLTNRASFLGNPVAAYLWRNDSQLFHIYP